MGVDLALMNQKQAEIAAQQAARSVGGVQYWNPSDGSSKIRMCPPWADNVRSFERSLDMHFGVGQEEQVFTCPGQGCPICAHVAALRATNDPGDAELAGRMAKKKRYYSNIVDLNDPVWTKKDYDEFKQAQPNEEPKWSVGQTKVQVFGYGAMIYGQLVNLFAQLQQDLTDLHLGYDLIITKVGVKLNTKYTVIPAPPARPLQIAGELVLHPLDALNPPRKNEDMIAALSGQPQAGGAGIPPGYGAQQQMAPPPNMPPTAALPPAQPAATPPPAQPQQAAAAQPKQPPAQQKPAAQVQTMAAPAQEPPPVCFKDKATFSQTDPECIGGQTADGQAVDKCPYFQECGEFAGKLLASPKGRRRNAAKVDPPTTAAPNGANGGDADDLEAQMQAALRGASA